MQPGTEMQIGFVVKGIKDLSIQNASYAAGKFHLEENLNWLRRENIPIFEEFVCHGLAAMGKLSALKDRLVTSGLTRSTDVNFHSSLASSSAETGQIATLGWILAHYGYSNNILPYRPSSLVYIILAFSF